MNEHDYCQENVATDHFHGCRIKEQSVGSAQGTHGDPVQQIQTAVDGSLTLEAVWMVSPALGSAKCNPIVIKKTTILPTKNKSRL